MKKKVVVKAFARKRRGHWEVVKPHMRTPADGKRQTEKARRMRWKKHHKK